MSDATGSDEAIVELGNAELIVPADAVMVDRKRSVRASTVIDATELFQFLGSFVDWPTNGLRLSEAARLEGYSEKLVRFLEGLPGSFATVADIMPYAEDPSKPPYGKAIVADPSAGARVDDSGDLTIGDVTQGKPG
jgi:hypothetical protein